MNNPITLLKNQMKGINIIKKLMLAKTPKNLSKSRHPWMIPMLGKKINQISIKKSMKSILTVTSITLKMETFSMNRGKRV